MSDYSKSLIYIVKCSEDKRVYYGSTARSLEKRIRNHKYYSKTSDNKLYKAIREYGFEKFTFEIVEKFPCGSREELVRREFDYIEKCSPDDLFNSDVKYGERPEEWRESRIGSNNQSFKGGCVYEEKSLNRWRVQWPINGKRHYKTFSYGIRSTLTSEQAELLAREFKSNLIF